MDSLEEYKKDWITTRKYRFTVNASSLSEDQTAIVKSFDFNATSKIVEIEVLDVVMKKDDKWQDNPWLEWAEKFPVEIVYNKPTKESLILTTYDSMGTPIMRYTFDNVSVRHAGSRFDYEAVDCSIIKLMCNYDTVKREFVYA